MDINQDYVEKLIREKNWSYGKFAMKAGVSKTTVSRWIHGKRGAGKKLMSGIVQAFPDEPLDKLFL